jgi:hypothetical protein
MVDLLIDKGFAPKALLPNMMVAPRAGKALVESNTFPDKANTSVGVTALFFQDVVDRNSVIKSLVAILQTHKHIVALVMIDLTFYLYAVRETEVQEHPPSRRAQDIGLRVQRLSYVVWF